MTENGPILFPGVTTGWATADEAKAHLAGLERNGDQTTHNVVFHVTGADGFKFVKCRVFAHRLAGTASKLTTEGEINTFDVTGVPWAGAADIAAWKLA